MLLFVVASSFASNPDPLPSHLASPTAVPMAAGTGVVEVGGVMAILGLGLHGAAVVAPSDRFAVFADGYLGGAQAFGSGWGGTVGARYQLLDERDWNVAAWSSVSTGVAHTPSDGMVVVDLFGPEVTAPFVREPTVHAGVAVEGGGPRIRFDATVPVVGVSTTRGLGDSLAWTATRSEAGVSFLFHRVHPNRHALRLGMTSLLPTLSWRFSPDRSPIYTELMVGVPFAGAKIGARF